MRLPLNRFATILWILTAAGGAMAQNKSIPITVRDFNASHPDFESVNGTCATDGGGVKGMVNDELDATHKPVQSAASPCPKYDIHTWFRDDAKVNKRYCLEMPLEEVAGKENTYKTPAAYTTAFFPIDMVPDPNPPHALIKAPDPITPGKAGEVFNNGHNFHFCMEMHATFKYRGGEVFDFKGDDDLWVFVNNHLALDLGGLQNNGAGQVDLDAQRAALKILPDNYYNFDFFFCERQTSESHLQVTTSIDIIPPPAPGLHIADENLNVITSGDTLNLDLGSDSRIFKSVKIETQTQTLDCNNLTSQIKTPASGNWTFNGVALPAGLQATVSSTGLAPGTYKVGLEKDGLRDSIWIRIAEQPQVATPTANPPGRPFAGSLAVALADATPGAVIHFTMDGTIPTATSPVYAAPLVVTGNTVIKAIATATGFRNSELMTETYARILAKAVRGYYQDRDGDGRIETAVILFDSNYSAAPKSVSFTDPFDRTKPVAAVSQAAGPGARTVTYSLPPFAPGTGFAAEVLATLAAEPEFAGQGVLMADSVGPVVKSVKAFPTAKADQSASVVIEFSEAVAVDAAAGLFPLEIKRGMGLVPDGDFKVATVVAESPTKIRVTFAPGSKFPVPGDSARIVPGRPVSDVAGNKSVMKFYVPVTGDAARADADLNVGLIDGVTRGPQTISVRPIPNPVVVHGEHTCVNCGQVGIRDVIPTQEPGKIAGLGPTWRVKTKYPFNYTMSFYDNVGQFVNKAEGDVGPADFEKLRLTELSGDSVLVQLTFLPLSHDGRAIGTGAYIMRGVMQIHDQAGIKGSQGETINLVPTERTLVSRFGYVRKRER